MYDTHKTTHLAMMCGLAILNLLAMGLDNTESTDVNVFLKAKRVADQ